MPHHLCILEHAKTSLNTQHLSQTASIVADEEECLLSAAQIQIVEPMLDLIQILTGLPYSRNLINQLKYVRATTRRSLNKLNFMQ